MDEATEVVVVVVRLFVVVVVMLLWHVTSLFSFATISLTTASLLTLIKLVDLGLKAVQLKRLFFLLLLAWHEARDGLFDDEDEEEGMSVDGGWVDRMSGELLGEMSISSCMQPCALKSSG